MNTRGLGSESVIFISMRCLDRGGMAHLGRCEQTIPPGLLVVRSS